jgi:hypothetical protein
MWAPQSGLFPSNLINGPAADAIKAASAVNIKEFGDMVKKDSSIPVNTGKTDWDVGCSREYMVHQENVAVDMCRYIFLQVQGLAATLVAFWSVTASIFASSIMPCIQPDIGASLLFV